MIIEGKKNTAFDLLEAAMQLSDIYHKLNVPKSVSISYYGHCESFEIVIYDWSGRKQPERLEDASVYLDVDYGGTFEKAFELIEKELAQYE